MRKIYKSALCFVLPSLFGETWGLVVNEAMASGLPVLVSEQAGCASTLVKNGVNGFTFSPDNEEELVNLFLKTGTISEEEQKMMGLKSCETILDWGLERFSSGIYDIINFVSFEKKRRTDLISKIIIKLWKGRYRPL